MKSSRHVYPPLLSRILGVWYRHMKVYTKNIFSNGFPPFVEPLIFLLGMGIGLGGQLKLEAFGTSNYVMFLAPGLIMTTAMFTAAYECSFGTFIRLEFDHVYDGMIAAPMTAGNLLGGEILWAGTKGFFFSSAVLLTVSLFGVINTPLALLAPFVGFLTGLMFGALSLLITSFVRTINHFNFYFTGLLSPMFFFSGVVIPVAKLPAGLREAAEVFPLTHTVRLSQALCLSRFSIVNLLDLVYVAVFIAGVTALAVMRLKKRLID
ncbi:MAG: ABC transporter [Spirochaetaceae bacterium]|nr:MAG: ABC transporter [Spirochaetaceae bacterium]